MPTGRAGRGRLDAAAGVGGASVLCPLDALSARWGYQRGGGFATTWFELGPGG